MVKRFAVVVWWIGALWFLGAAAALPIGLATGDPGQKFSLAFGLSGVFASCGAVCWTLVYILAGTFLRPPTVE